MTYPTREDIRALCTEQSFERGVTYWKQGRIQELDIDGSEIRATVRGSHDYDVSIDVAADSIRTHCSCPYDYAGDCKHIVAVLLAVDDRDADTDTDSVDEPAEKLQKSVDVEALIEETTADELRTFLIDVIEDDRDLRDRFVAFAGEDSGKTVYDYKREIDRLFEDAANRRGLIEYDTRIDFSKYYDLAATHRERGHVETATDIYRALAEAIRENMNRIDDSSGHYGRELESAVESYAETIAERDLDHEEKRPYIEYLFEEFVEADYHFASEDYDDALRTVCTTEADLKYWLDLLDSHVSGVALEPTALAENTTARTDDEEAVRTENRGRSSQDESPSNSKPEGTQERTDDVLYASDFTDGPLTVKDFTGDALDVKHLAVGPLELEYFVGDAFEDLHVDDPTTVEEHTADLEPAQSSSNGTGISSSLRTRNALSTYIYLLEELDEEDALSVLYEEIYLEHSRFCKQYAERLIDQGNEERAIEVVEDGIDTFRSTTALRWLAAELYRDREPDEYRDTLKQLFIDHTEWNAYDELKDACDDREWASTYEEFERYLDENDRRRLIAMYVHEGELQKAFSELKDSENLSWVRRYRDPVARVDPAEFFELYRELLVPFAAGETGRRHYREIADHLEEMRGLVSEERFEEFVDFLKEEHSNRPAFLDELEKAGF